MAPIPVEEQFQFLLSCIRFSNSGKIDFEQVAKECNIVSRGAAAKRYERLMKAHNISLSGGNASAGSNRSPEKSTDKFADDSSIVTPTKKGSGVKRKVADSKGSPKKARLMKKAAVVCAEDLVKSNEGSDGEYKPAGDVDVDDDDDDDDGSLFKGVVAGEEQA